MEGASPKDLERADANLLRVIDGACEEAKRRAGSRLACHAGCFSCCYGPFPITQLDAWRLRRGLGEMERDDPARAAAIRRRAAEAEARLLEDFPGDAATGEIRAEEEWLPRGYSERHNLVPCPALDPETGACGMYAHRPIACRTFGPPSIIEGKKMAPCRLCFRGSGEDEIERCRVEFRGAAEGEVAARLLEQQHPRRGRTLIAFALSGMRYRF